MTAEPKRYRVGDQELTLEQLRLAADVYLGIVDEDPEASEEVRGFLEYLARQEAEEAGEGS